VQARADRSVREEYLRFAREEARGQSALLEQWAEGVAGDAELLELIAALAPGKQQPNLIFAAARYAGAPVGPFLEVRDWLAAHWDEVRDEVSRRRTQTNEPGRCAVLLPLLASLPQPLALLEVGASAGLCLYPDRYSYDYSDVATGDRTTLDPADGPSSVQLQCRTTGPVPLPAALPHVVWRRGIDINPLSVASADDVQWLRTLIWPEQDDRRRRFDAAVAIARSDPPRLIPGDLNDLLTVVAAEAPRAATLVVFHTAVLAYLDPPGRRRFAESVTRLPGHWISNEGPGVMDFGVRDVPPPPDSTTAAILLALDGRPVAYAAPHGQRLDWFSGGAA
jgi:hypothetical protein